MQVYQKLIGILRWEVDIGRVDILLEISLISSELALRRVGYLQAIYRMFRYLNKVPKRKLYFDPRKPMTPVDILLNFDWEYLYPGA